MARCSVEGCEIEAKKKGLCQKHYQKEWRAALRKAEEAAALPANLGEMVATARSAEDWQRVAAAVQPVMQGILDGTTKASAAQVALLKDVLNRAYGKPVATQEERKTSAGVIILPTLGDGAVMMLCPKCGFDIAKGGEGLHARVMVAVANAAHVEVDETEDTLGP